MKDVLIEDALFESAIAAANTANRTVEDQIEYWITIGMIVSTMFSETQIEKLLSGEYYLDLK